MSAAVRAGPPRARARRTSTEGGVGRVGAGGSRCTVPSRSVARRRTASAGISATRVSPSAVCRCGAPGAGAGMSTRVSPSTTVTGTSEEKTSTPCPAATRSAEARVRVPWWPHGPRGTSTGINGHESAATATGTPFTTAVPGPVPAPRCGTARSWPPPSSRRADGAELVGTSVVRRGPRVSMTRARIWASAYSGRSVPVEET